MGKVLSIKPKLYRFDLLSLLAHLSFQCPNIQSGVVLLVTSFDNFWPLFSYSINNQLRHAYTLVFFLGIG